MPELSDKWKNIKEIHFHLAHADEELRFAFVEWRKNNAKKAFEHFINYGINIGKVNLFMECIDFGDKDRIKLSEKINKLRNSFVDFKI